MKNTHPFHIEIPRSLWARFIKLAKANHRTKKAEALIAIENHVREIKQKTK